MSKQIKLGEVKVLEIDPITLEDTKYFFDKFLNGYTEEGLGILEKRINESERDRDLLETQFYNKGKRLWLEIDVVDSYASSGLISWLFSQSAANGNKSGLRLFGCTLNSISWEKPSDYTPEEKEAIKRLYEKVIGDQPK